jgi:hypothetical protein
VINTRKSQNKSPPPVFHSIASSLIAAGGPDQFSRGALLSGVDEEHDGIAVGADRQIRIVEVIVGTDLLEGTADVLGSQATGVTCIGRHPIERRFVASRVVHEFG